LRDRNYLVRGYAIDAMARMDLLGAREQIEEILSNPAEESFVHRKAAEALGQIGTLESLQVLERCLFKEQARTRWAIRGAIAEINQRNSLSAVR
jgi:HEAT repeat protein